MMICLIFLAANLAGHQPSPPPPAKEEAFSARRLMDLQAAKRATRSPAVGLDAAEAARINQMRIDAIGKKVMKQSGGGGPDGSSGSGPR